MINSRARIDMADDSAFMPKIIVNPLNTIHFSNLVEAVDDRTKKIPFMMISAEAQKHQFSEAVKQGFPHYIVKPFTRETLQRGLAKISKK